MAHYETIPISIGVQANSSAGKSATYVNVMHTHREFPVEDMRAEAENMKMRSQLMMSLKSHLWVG